MDDPEMYLHEIGLSKYEAAAYSALLREGKATAKEVASASDIPQSRVYDILEKLATKGFVRSQPGRPKKFGAVDPERALEQYGEYRRKEFESEYDRVMAVGEEFVDAAETYRSSNSKASEPEIVWSYHSEHQLFDIFEQLCRGTTEEIRMITRADSIERKVSRLKEVLWNLSEAGVRLRVLLPQDQLVNDAVVDRLSEYAEIRRGQRIEAQIYVFDREAILMAFKGDDDDQYVGLTVRSEELSGTLIQLFEVLWADSIPLETTDGGA